MFYVLKYLKHSFHDHLRLERMKLKDPDTNDHERNVSTNVLKIGNNCGDGEVTIYYKISVFLNCFCSPLTQEQKGSAHFFILCWPGAAGGPGLPAHATELKMKVPRKFRVVWGQGGPGTTQL